MSDFGNTADLPPDFSGIVRLFPLPNLVLFPHAMQPLHIFEPRYRELLEDSLTGDRLIAMALLSPGWQADYEGRPPIESVVCIGKVQAHDREVDGKYNLLLHGVRRARLIRELPPDRSFRLAEVTLLEDEYPPEGAPQRAAMQRDLLAHFRALLPAALASHEHFSQVWNLQTPLGVLTDITAFTLQFSLALKQELLAECNVDLRAARLLEYLAARANLAVGEEEAGGRTFPPEFSDN